MQESNMLASRCWNKFHFVSTELLFIASKLSANSCSSFFMRVLSALFLMYVWVAFSCSLQRVPYHDRLFPGWPWHYKQLFWISQKPNLTIVLIYIERKNVFASSLSASNTNRANLTCLPVTLSVLDMIIVYLQRRRHRRWFRKFTVRFRPIRKEIVQCIIIYDIVVVCQHEIDNIVVSGRLCTWKYV